MLHADFAANTIPAQSSRRQTRNVGQYEEVDMDTIPQLNGEIEVYLEAIILQDH